MKKKQKQRYRDGFIYFLKEKKKISDFNAKENPTKFTLVAKAPFDKKTIRISDLEMENIFEKKIEKKIVIPFFNIDLESNYYIQINKTNALYNVLHADPTDNEIYLYLCAYKGGNRHVDIE